MALYYIPLAYRQSTSKAIPVYPSGAVNALILGLPDAELGQFRVIGILF